VAFLRHSTEIVYRPPGNAGAAVSADVARASGRGAFLGVVGGAALGYRAIFVAAELTVVRFTGSATLDVFGRTASADTSSWVISPGIGLMGEF
jgi:hypothetical protein